MNYTNLLWIMFALVVMEGKTLHHRVDRRPEPFPTSDQRDPDDPLTGRPT